MKNKAPITKRSTWVRLLYMALYAGVFQLVWAILALIAIVQILSRLFTGETFRELRSLGGKLADFAHDIVAFMTFHTDRLPFPFEPSRGEVLHAEEELADYSTGV